MRWCLLEPEQLNFPLKEEYLMPQLETLRLLQTEKIKLVQKIIVFYEVENI